MIHHLLFQHFWLEPLNVSAFGLSFEGMTKQHRNAVIGYVTFS
jgi:hypothetical protein